MRTAVAILSYGKADAIPTYQLLKGRTSLPIWIYVSDDDKQVQKYEEKYTNVVIFNKKSIRGTFDLGTNAPLYNHAIYARNYILRDMLTKGYEAVWMVDDDIKDIKLRYPINGSCPSAIPSNLDNMFRYFEDFLASSPRISALSAYQDGGFFGTESFRLKRWISQFMLFRVPIEITINGQCEDTRVSIDLAERGGVTYALPFVTIHAAKMGKSTMKYTDSFYEFHSSLYVVCPSGMALKMKKGIASPVRMNRYIFPKLIPERLKKK